MHRLTAPAALALALLALSCDDDQPVAADMLQQPDRHVVDNAMPGDSASEQGCITPPEMGPVDGPRADLSLDATADAWPDRSVPPDLPGSDAAADATVDLPASDTVAADAPAADAPATDATVPDATVPDAPVPDATVPDTVSGPCPPCMELMGGTFCIDRYEASRPDATSSYQGVQNTKAMCQPYVMPWYSMVLSRN